REPLQEQQTALLERYATAWVGPVMGTSPRWWEFQRGLPFARWSVPREGPDLDEFVGSELWAWVEGLRVWCIEDVEEVRRLATSRCLATVTHLDLSRNEIGPEGAAILAATPALAGLRDLTLHEAGEIGDDGAIALARSSHLRRLRKLDLAINGIGARG